MAAVTADGPSRILNAASEPHVQGLCRALKPDGRKIAASGRTSSRSRAFVRCTGPSTASSPDHIEIGSFVAMAAMTGGELRVLDVVPDHLRMIRLAFARLGVDTVIDGTTLLVPPGQKPVIVSDVGGAVPKIDDGHGPDFRPT